MDYPEGCTSWGELFNDGHRNLHPVLILKSLISSRIRCIASFCRMPYHFLYSSIKDSVISLGEVCTEIVWLSIATLFLLLSARQGRVAGFQGCCKGRKKPEHCWKTFNGAHCWRSICVLLVSFPPFAYTDSQALWSSVPWRPGSLCGGCARSHHFGVHHLRVRFLLRGSGGKS